MAKPKAAPVKAPVQKEEKKAGEGESSSDEEQKPAEVEGYNQAREE